ncbi:hypothetical protein C798_06300 [Herbaspirillum rubrisubalbicans Os34]|uniref:Filamentous haemagglutinin FhaB/tRNA nuclease CdiA-like TPS domain-containing protein n=1 Tax=Herbaspirillum rubrisubalbicans Os34 TaxID=1235827 RepID=A0A6M3ZYY1_9BURK|nr:filamentous hemagglutinin N-terminal domain-containing protein [Herbaspirillum rubrisubalbicans]QJQ03874.1 hypothetical protein C798_06300 [Herbaspirillum rubrisubalbicans Os34]
MNKIYRLVFSKHHGMLVAVAENAVSQRKGGGGMVIGGRIDLRVPLTVRRLTMAVMAAFSMSTVLPSWAAAPLPTGGVVSSGTGSINVNGQTMSIQQGSQVLGLNWTGFSIGAGNTVNFAQPSVSAVAVNRVIGTEASQIYGNLNANGQIYLINPNGIVFGSTAQVNVGSLLASTATNVSIDGNSVVLSGQSGATVVNQGNIKATDGGFVVLSGQQVSNSGRIQANGGYVALMAGDKVSLQLDNGALVSVNVDASAVQALVDNKGLILADGGKVYLTAWGKNTLLSTVVNNDGIIRARGYGSSAGGTVVLLGEGGDTVTRGSIDVSGQGAGQQGGTVVLGGDRVGVFDNATIDASGVAGGGRVVIGGDSLNKARSVANIGFANSTYVGSNATVNIGSSQGDGGFVETSGENLAMLGRVNATSAGKAGQWLIDPTNITINTGSSNATNSSNTWSGSGTDSVVNNASIEAALNSGANVTVTTNSSGSGTGWINVAANIAKTSGGNASLTLYANGAINISGYSITSSSNLLNISMSSVGDGVTLTNSTLNSNGGAINISSCTAVLNNPNINTNGGNLTISTNGGSSGPTMTLWGCSTLNVGSGFGNLSVISSTWALNLIGSLTTIGNINITGQGGSDAGVYIQAPGNIASTGGNLAIKGITSMASAQGGGLQISSLNASGNISFIGISNTNSAGVWIGQSAVVTGANITGSSASGAGVNATNSNVTGTTIVGSSASGVGVNLTNVNVVSGYITGTGGLVGVNLSQTNVNGTNIVGSSNGTGVNITNSSVTGGNVAGTGGSVGVGYYNWTPSTALSTNITGVSNGGNGLILSGTSAYTQAANTTLNITGNTTLLNGNLDLLTSAGNVFNGSVVASNVGYLSVNATGNLSILGVNGSTLNVGAIYVTSGALNISNVGAFNLLSGFISSSGGAIKISSCTATLSNTSINTNGGNLTVSVNGSSGPVLNIGGNTSLNVGSGFGNLNAVSPAWAVNLTGSLTTIGNINITGQGGWDAGVYIQAPGNIASTGGNLAIKGITSMASAQGGGLQISSLNASGNISFIGISNTNSAGVWIGQSAVVTGRILLVLVPVVRV